MNTLTDVNWSTWSLWVKHMPKWFSGLEILLFPCKSVSKCLQAGMLVFWKVVSHLMVIMALLNVILPVSGFFSEMFQFFFLFQPLNVLFKGNCYFSFLTLHYSVHVCIVLAFLQFTLSYVLAFHCCAFLSHFCVILTEVLYLFCPCLRKSALTKFLPSPCKKAKWTVIAVFCFPEGWTGRWGKVHAAHFGDQIHRKHFGRGGIVLLILVSQACVQNLSVVYRKCWLCVCFARLNKLLMHKCCGGK